MALGKVRIDASLFNDEDAILRSALANIKKEQHCGDELLSSYKSLVSHYQKLLKITKKVFRISDSQGQVLQQHQNEIQNLLDNANQGFLTFGRDLKVDRQNSAECTRIFGREIAGLTITRLLGQGNDSLEKELIEIFARAFYDRTQRALDKIPSVLRIDGKDIRAECKIIAQAEEMADGILVMMILTDITERLKAEEQIRFLSYHDKLTTLYNRAHVETVMPKLEQPEFLPMSIIMLDMNGLKLVNDVLGHQQGDLLLVAIAKVLKQSCEPKDIVARWGGDEFLIILPQSDNNDCRRVCERIINACNEVHDTAIPLSAAIGTATIESGVARLAEMFNVAENRMYNDKLKKVKEVRKGMIASLENILCNRCFENSEHNERLKKLVIDFADFLGLDMDANDIKPIMQLARLHDIGKVAIPEEILEKQDPLTLNEWEIIKSHSDIGYRMAQSIGETAVADIIIALHERWDGSGYPYGLKGDQIPMLARIFALVETYDVITNDRPYKRVMDKLGALREIESGIGSQFDPELAKKFLEYIVSKS